MGESVLRVDDFVVDTIHNYYGSSVKGLVFSR